MNVAKIASRVIPFDELPAWSPWPARLLGLTDWKAPVRTLEKVEREYDKDKYKSFLEFAHAQVVVPTATEVSTFEFQVSKQASFCVSQKGTLYELPSDKILPCDHDLLMETMTPLMEKIDTVVEIGCGYGINLWNLHKQFPDKRFVGGEYSQNAVELARLLFAKQPAITVEPCNFYDNAYHVLEQCPRDGRTLLFTRHAIEQLPTAAPVLKTLTQYFDRLAAVVHLEIVVENSDDSLLGLLRKQYVAANDYNRDLLGQLRQRTDIEILKNDPDAYGQNPFNPTSVIVWKPK